MSRQLLTNFTKGVFSPELWGRPDTPQYRAGVKRADNFIIQKFGGLAFRPGFRFAAEADDVETPLRYIQFQYSIEQAYILVLQDLAMRVLALGAYVAEDNLEITAITKDEEAQVTALFHAFEEGDRVYFDGIEGMVEMNGRFGIVTDVLDDDNFTVDIDSTGFSTFISSDGITRDEEPDPPPATPSPPPTPTPDPPPPDTGGGGGNGSGISEGPPIIDAPI